jgi:hypothetical protein
MEKISCVFPSSLRAGCGDSYWSYSGHFDLSLPHLINGHDHFMKNKRSVEWFAIQRFCTTQCPTLGRQGFPNVAHGDVVLLTCGPVMSSSSTSGYRMSEELHLPWGRGALYVHNQEGWQLVKVCGLSSSEYGKHQEEISVTFHRGLVWSPTWS